MLTPRGRKVVGTGAALGFIAHPMSTISNGGPQTKGEWAVFGAQTLFALLSMIFGWKQPS